MISLKEAQRFILEQCPPQDPRVVPLGEALGCVVGAPIIATEANPPFTNSSMDGYALRAVDTADAPCSLQVVGTLLAGHPLEGTVGPGQAMRIMTGAPLPPGADAVCMIEETKVAPDEASVLIQRAARSGQFVREPGRDVEVGAVIASIGSVLTPAHLGVLANQGLVTAVVHPRPRLGVLSTGDELFSGIGSLPKGKIRDANRHALLGVVQREGWIGIDLGQVGDDPDQLRKVLSRAGSMCDAIVTSGGVSVGDLDLVRSVLAEESTDAMRWMQVAIRPAKPLAFGLLAESGVPVFGLPGNPVSALVSFELFVRPAIRRLTGHRVLHRDVVLATTSIDLPRQEDGKLHLLRAEVSLDARSHWHVRTAKGQESHLLFTMAEANALILLPDGPGASAGDLVPTLIVDPSRLSRDESLTLCWPAQSVDQ